jgi:hypothetical protein
MQRLRCEVSWYTGLARSGANEDFAELPEVTTAEAYSFYGVDFYDEATGFVLHEVYLENFEGSKLPEYIREKIQDVEANQSVPLDWVRLTEHPEFRAEVGKRDKLPLRLRHESSVLPYRVHGGRELDLMLKGLKPLSVFSRVEARSGLASFLSRHFEPLVGCGELVSARLDDDGSTAPTLMFALPNEAWRFEAYRLMTDTARATNWNDALERIEGSLLGYTLEQNNYWLSYRKRKGYRWGRQTAYRLLPDTEIEFVRKTGRKAFRFDDNPIRLYVPHESHDQSDPGAALTHFRRTALARFYFPMVKFMEFSRGVIRCANVDFDVFEIPDSELARLNELIDGTIDLIEFGEFDS